MTRIHEAMRRAALFAQDERFDGQTRREAAQAMENEQELLARFGSELAFGTGGLRGILGVGTARMNRYVVERATPVSYTHLDVYKRQVRMWTPW